MKLRSLCPCFFLRHWKVRYELNGIPCQTTRRGLFMSLNARSSSLGLLVICIHNRMISSQVLERVCCVSHLPLHVTYTFYNKHYSLVYIQFLKSKPFSYHRICDLCRCNGAVDNEKVCTIYCEFTVLSILWSYFFSDQYRFNTQPYPQVK